MLLYPATFRRDTGSVVLLFPDFPQGGHTNGKDEAEALRHAPDALKATISMLMEQGLGVPLPGKAPGRRHRLIALPSVIDDAKTELYIGMRDSGVRKSELARRMGIHKQQVERLLDMDHTSRIEQLEAAFTALGKRLMIAIGDAA